MTELQRLAMQSASKARLKKLEEVFIKAIEDFSKKDKNLTLAEVDSVMLKFLSYSNNKQLNY